MNKKSPYKSGHLLGFKSKYGVSREEEILSMVNKHFITLIGSDTGHRSPRNTTQYHPSGLFGVVVVVKYTFSYFFKYIYQIYLVF